MSLVNMTYTFPIEYLTRTKITDWGVHTFLFSRCAVFQSCCVNLSFHQQCVRIPILLHLHKHLVLSVFFILAILFTLIYVNLPTPNEWWFLALFHMFIGILDICFCECLFKSFAHFSIYESYSYQHVGVFCVLQILVFVGN